MFAAQIVSSCIPSCQRLTDRHIGVDICCPTCGADNKTINHIFFECHSARQVWALSNIPSAPDVFPSASVVTNIDYLMWRAKDSGGDVSSIKIFPWILWYIWKARNLKAFENKTIPPDVTLAIATQEAEAYRLANLREEVTMTSLISQTTDPSPPGTHRIICQIDGSWTESDSQSGHGWILAVDGRTSNLGLKSQSRFTTPLHAELDSLIWAMRCIKELQMCETVFQIDCKDLISLVEAPEE